MIDKVLKYFKLKGKFISVVENTVGNTNKTYVATFLTEDGCERRYLVQEINTMVYDEPIKLMKNIDNVSKYLKMQLVSEGDYLHQVLEVVKTLDDELFYYDNENGCFRVYEYIENAFTIDCSSDKNVVYNIGVAVGNFQRLLRDYPINNLEDVNVDYHNTYKRYKKFIGDMNKDLVGRVINVNSLIEFILNRENVCSLITNKLNDGVVPYRVIHGDTKINNIMINKDTGDFQAVIDLDTVMSGSLLYDYGDGVRSTAATAFEDETDLSKVKIDLELFSAYTDGYLSEMAPYMTYDEVSLMGESIRIITLELAIRFLNDYINGDTYFKINYEHHNLDRARNQIALVRDIESKMEYINNYIMDSYNRIIQTDVKVRGLAK